MKTSTSGQALQLVESYRNSEGSPRQRIVLSLGNASILEKHWSLLASVVESRLYGGFELFPECCPPEIQRWCPIIVRRVELQGRWRPERGKVVGKLGAGAADSGSIQDGVLVDQVEHGDTVVLGPYLIGWALWRELDLDNCLARLGFNPSQRQAACVSVLNRLVDPGSERRLHRGLLQTALPELVGEAVLSFGKDRYYRISDRLYQNRTALEAHLRIRQRHLFGLSRTIFLYDLTNTYFEGSQKRNPKAKRGHSKHKRDDSPQVVVGMVFDQHGFSLGHEIFEGNRTDSKTLTEILKRLSSVVAEEQDLFKQARPMVIMDAGIATKANLKELRSQNYSYLVNDSRRGRKVYEKEFTEVDKFESISGRTGKTPVRVRVIKEGGDAESNEEGSEAAKEAKTTEHGLDRLVLCMSEGRRAKELAMRSKVEEKFIAALKKLQARVSAGRLKAVEKIDQAIGRVRASHPRAACYYEVRREEKPGKDGAKEPEKCEVVWSRDEGRYAQADHLLGCYVLRTDRDGVDAQLLWTLYVTLAKAEAGFRCLKSDVGLRPNHHQVEGRVDGHIFISILAYHLLQTLSYRLHKAGDSRSWETVKRVVETHTYATLKLPIANGSLVRIRKPSIPDEAQKEIYRKLGIDWATLPTKTLQPSTTPPQ